MSLSDISRGVPRRVWTAFLSSQVSPICTGTEDGHIAGMSAGRLPAPTCARQSAATVRVRQLLYECVRETSFQGEQFEQCREFLETVRTVGGKAVWSASANLEPRSPPRTHLRPRLPGLKVTRVARILEDHHISSDGKETDVDLDLARDDQAKLCLREASGNAVSSRIPEAAHAGAHSRSPSARTGCRTNPSVEQRTVREQGSPAWDCKRVITRATRWG